MRCSPTELARSTTWNRCRSNNPKNDPSSGGTLRSAEFSEQVMDGTQRDQRAVMWGARFRSGPAKIRVAAWAVPTPKLDAHRV